MKGNSGSRKLTVMTVLFGIAALAMRRALYATAVDVKGLLVRNQPLGIALTVLTLGVLIRIALAVRKKDGDVCETHPSANLPAALGSVAAAAGILVTAYTGGNPMSSPLENAWYVLGLAAAPCLLLAGVARLFGKQPIFLLHVTVCLFFVVHIVTRYQLWSANPQLQDYVFALLGAMALMFFGFYTAAREAECGNDRMKLGMGLAAIYLCLAELARSSCPALYLGGAIWVLTDLIGRKDVSDDKI